MSSRGKEETERLIENSRAQLSRLLTQLQDCEDLKEDLDPEEYEETRADTLQQLKEFQETLTRMTSGDNTLVSQLGSVQLVRFISFLFFFFSCEIFLFIFHVLCHF